MATFLEFMEGRDATGVWKLTPDDVSLIDCSPSYRCPNKNNDGTHFRTMLFWTAADGKEKQAMCFCPAEGMKPQPGQRLVKNPAKGDYGVSYNLV